MKSSMENKIKQQYVETLQVRQIIEIAKRFHIAMELQVYYLSSVSLEYYAYVMVGQPLLTNISSRLT